MDPQSESSDNILRLILERLKPLTFPDLIRPPRHTVAAVDIRWGARVYCYAVLRHLTMLLDGVLSLYDSNNLPSARIVARSAFEVGAHAYYVTKHMKQHIQKEDWAAAWRFLTPIATASCGINQQIPEPDELFPTPAHISKVINCFREVMPTAATEDYSYLSEFCHPNAMAFLQHYDWVDPTRIKFAPAQVHGFLGTTTAASLQGLLSINELLEMAQEREIRQPMVNLLKTIVETAKSE